MLRYGQDQEVVNFLAKTVADPLRRRHGPPGVSEPRVKTAALQHSRAPVLQET